MAWDFTRAIPNVRWSSQWPSLRENHSGRRVQPRSYNLEWPIADFRCLLPTLDFLVEVLFFGGSAD